MPLGYTPLPPKRPLLHRKIFWLVILTIFSVGSTIGLITLGVLYAVKSNSASSPTPPDPCEGKVRCTDGKCCTHGCQCINGQCGCVASCAQGFTSCTVGVESGCCPPAAHPTYTHCSGTEAKCCDDAKGTNCASWDG